MLRAQSGQIGRLGELQGTAGFAQVADVSALCLPICKFRKMHSRGDSHSNLTRQMVVATPSSLVELGKYQTFATALDLGCKLHSVGSIGRVPADIGTTRIGRYLSHLGGGPGLELRVRPLRQQRKAPLAGRFDVFQCSKYLLMGRPAIPYFPMPQPIRPLFWTGFVRGTCMRPHNPCGSQWRGRR